MEIKYRSIGICGLPCQLCSMYHLKSKGKCEGCKSEVRMKKSCPFITCAIKKRKVEFCWECNDSPNCDKWNRRRLSAKEFDSVKCCYQKLEDDILFINENGIEEFKRLQDIREEILRDLLLNFNEGRSKSYYCVAATTLDIKTLKEAITKAKENSIGLDIKDRSKTLHKILDKISSQKKIVLKLRR